MGENAHHGEALLQRCGLGRFVGIGDGEEKEEAFWAWLGAQRGGAEGEVGDCRGVEGGVEDVEGFGGWGRGGEDGEAGGGGGEGCEEGAEVGEGGGSGGHFGIKEG